MDSLTLILFACGFFALIGGVELIVRGTSRPAVTVGSSPLVVGLTVVAFSTSAPELGVSLMSSFSGQPGIAPGNLVGSNIANILLILGLSALAAHLTGVIAGHTRLPVIGLPLGNGPCSGWDSLFSTVQMPPGPQVATAATDGFRNAAIMTACILALKYPYIDLGLQELAAREAGAL